MTYAETLHSMYYDDNHRHPCPYPYSHPCPHPHPHQHIQAQLNTHAAYTVYDMHMQIGVTCRYEHQPRQRYRRGPRRRCRRGRRRRDTTSLIQRVATNITFGDRAQRGVCGTGGQQVTIDAVSPRGRATRSAAPCDAWRAPACRGSGLAF